MKRITPFLNDWFDQAIRNLYQNFYRLWKQFFVDDIVTENMPAR